ncbi:MAG TPA: pitrilysin family protein [Acidobacteriota bacterium]|nr:pitrilysin family protein [Acidobacteriota bacterium]
MNIKSIKHWFIVFLAGISFFLAASSMIYANHDIWKTTPMKMKLENGATILYEKDDSSKITVLQFYIKGGKLAEPDNKEGLSYVTTRLVLEIPDRQKAQDFMLQATNLMMYSENDYSAVIVTCLSEKLEASLKIISDIMLNPLFSTLRINRIKENMLIRDKVEQDESRNIAYKTIRGLLFKDTGYDGSVYGDEKSLKQIKKKDIVEFYDKHFTAENMLIVVSTDLDKEVITDYFNQYFSKLKNGISLSSRNLTLPSIETQTLRHISRETKQTFVAIGYRLPPISLKNYVLALMLENLLGKGIGSKLWPIRKEKKLAYNISAHTSYFKNGGLLEALLETENTKKETALESVNDTLEILFSEGISSEELNTTKVYTKASFLRSNETKRDRTSTLAFFEIMDLGLDSFMSIFNAVDSIKLEEMNDFIHKVLDPENRVTVTVGPEQKSEAIIPLDPSL